MDMKPLSELISTKEHAWSLVMDWLKSGRNQFEVLGTDRERAENVLYELQVTTRSPIGAIAYECGGILVDNGWLRILGSGNKRVYGDLLYWNGLGQKYIENPIKGALVVAYDVIGGFFALNGGAFSGDLGKVFYLAPDTLQWEDLQTSYSGFLQWAANGNLNLYYQTYRWNGWEDDVKKLSAEKGISFYPPLWTIGDVSYASSRKSVPLVELWDFINQN